MAKRTFRIVCAAGFALAVAVAVGIAGGALLGPSQTWSAITVMAILSMLIVLAIAACAPWWRNIDDAARDAHKTSWWWGGCTGMGVGFICAMVASGGAHSPMARGAIIVIGCEVAAYAVTWAGWWLARRPISLA